MARRTYVRNYDQHGNPAFKPDGTAEFVLKHERIYGPHREGEKRSTHMVMGDIDPYQSTIDGSMITSRSKHRQHLKQHNCVEIGCDSVDSAQKHFERPELSKKDRLNDVRHAYDKAEARG